VDLCPKIAKTNEKNGGDLKKLGFGFFCGKNGKMGGNGGRRWVVMVERGRRWYGGWWGSDGWWWVWILGIDWEEENREGRGRGLYGTAEEWRK
jgi:hypothetical protein